MPVYYDIAVEDLPEQLRSDLPAGAKVNITVEVADGDLPGYTQKQLDDMLSFSEDDLQEATVLTSRDDIERHMDALKERASANWKIESAALRKLA
jgi:hypothetical protein